MASTLKDSLHLVSNPQILDAGVQEVFQAMLGLRCERLSDQEEAQRPSLKESVTAVVGLGGCLSGTCVFRCDSHAAIELVQCMTGIAFDDLDDVVKDGIGELCNMLAGAWKGRVPELAASSGLSVPAVITGHDYKIHVQSPEFQLRHRYRFGAGEFELMIVCDSLH